MIMQKKILKKWSVKENSNFYFNTFPKLSILFNTIKRLFPLSANYLEGFFHRIFAKFSSKNSGDILESIEFLVRVKEFGIENAQVTYLIPP